MLQHKNSYDLRKKTHLLVSSYLTSAGFHCPKLGFIKSKNKTEKSDNLCVTGSENLLLYIPCFRTRLLLLPCRNLRSRSSAEKKDRRGSIHNSLRQFTFNVSSYVVLPLKVATGSRSVLHWFPTRGATMYEKFEVTFYPGLFLTVDISGDYLAFLCIWQAVDCYRCQRKLAHAIVHSTNIQVKHKVVRMLNYDMNISISRILILVIRYMRMVSFAHGSFQPGVTDFSNHWIKTECTQIQSGRGVKNPCHSRESHSVKQ